MKRIVWACLFATATMATGPVLADQLQWEKNDKAMADFVAEGYELKAITTSQNAAGSWTTYFLQKAGKLVKCDQAYFLASQNNKVIGCFDLAKPFEAKSK